MTDTLLIPDPGRTADVSPCGRYRWTLTYRWADGPMLGWLMCNPSKADATVNDPTFVRTVGFGRTLGYAGVMLGNTHAYRATDPRDLLAAHRAGVDVVGPRNDDALRSLAAACRVVIAAWGNDKLACGRAAHVMGIFAAAGADVRCLGTTKDGHPKHPLARGVHRVPDDFVPVPFTLNTKA